MTRDTRDLPYEYKGVSTVLRGIAGEFCDNCGEVVFNQEDGQHYMDLVREFQRKVNADLVDPDFIMRVRKKLRLNQKQAGDVFGGGSNAFSRYETGKAKPPVSLVKLLHVLDRHPELLTEVMGPAQGAAAV
jgi:HTH-type transcriptional regulator/antitoxin MqsA